MPARGDWCDWIGPMVGVLIAVAACSRLTRRIEVARLYHFEHDRRRLFHRMAGT
jgi:hypothetical protein